MNGPLLIGYMAATADIERRNQTQRDGQQRAALKASRIDSGATGHVLTRFGGWLRTTSAFAGERTEATCAAPAC